MITCLSKEGEVQMVRLTPFPPKFCHRKLQGTKKAFIQKSKHAGGDQDISKAERVATFTQGWGGGQWDRPS